MADDLGRKGNEERGEMTLLLAGTPMGLRPSYEAIVAFEAALDRGLVDIARDAVAGKLKLGEVAQVAAECIRAWGRDTDNKDAAGAGADRIARLILDSEGGLYAIGKTVSGMLSLAVTGGYTSSGEIRPLTTTTTTQEAPVDG
jgi:hypothetical protein